MEPVELLMAEARAGAPGAIDRLFGDAYPELRRMAHQRLQRTQSITLLDTTALVHECYLRLAKLARFGNEDRPLFMGYAARTMRSIIIDLLRQRAAERHGGKVEQVTLAPDRDLMAVTTEDDLLRINDALEELAALDPRLVQVVEMRFFAGLTFEEIAQALGHTERTARRDWQKARLLLHSLLQR